MKLIAIVALAITACSSTSSPDAAKRKVSSALAFPLPPGQRVLFECQSKSDGSLRAVISLNDPLKSAQQPNLGDGTSRVVKAMRKIGSENLQVMVVDKNGHENIAYGEEIEGDLHNGAHHFFPEDVNWPRGRWQSKSAQLLFHPDGSHEFEGTHATDENVELRLDGGEVIKCYLPSDLRTDCC